MTSSSTHVELLLPERIRLKADIRGNEYAWRRADLPEVLAAAREAELATLGGEVQFRLEDGTCELYWHSFDSAKRADGESWSSYVERTNRETLASLERLPSEETLVVDGVTKFEFLRDCANRGVDLLDFLWYVCYFARRSGE